jgi:hypothetical protein
MSGGRGVLDGMNTGVSVQTGRGVIDGVADSTVRLGVKVDVSISAVAVSVGY